MSFQSKQIGIAYGAVIFLSFMPFVTPVLALSTGMVFSILGLKLESVAKYTAFSLQASIVLMGFGMNLAQVIGTMKAGFWSTALSVTCVMACGLIIGKLLKTDSKMNLLIASGTAICGGSAIAAVAPIINAKGDQISFSLVVVFILNAVALVIFPLIGHWLNLSQETFGYWAAIAIHDTSSVVGAGATYGAKALEIATTVKLIRALWIIPVSIVIALLQKDSKTGKVKIPWFIGLFVLSIVSAYLFPAFKDMYVNLHWLGKRGMVIALFLIGSNISIHEAKKTGLKGFILGIALWLIIGVGSLLLLTIKF